LFGTIELKSAILLEVKGVGVGLFTVVVVFVLKKIKIIETREIIPKIINFLFLSNFSISAKTFSFNPFLPNLTTGSRFLSFSFNS